MTYVVIRLLTGSNQHSVEERTRVGVEKLVPKLKQAGCQRISFIQLDDGRIGTVSRYPDAQSAAKAADIAARFIQDTPELQGYKVEQVLKGELIFGFTPDEHARFDGAYGSLRIYQSAASTDDHKQALEQEALPILKQAGRDILSYAVIKLDDDSGVVALTAHPTQEAAAQNTQAAQAKRQQTGSLLSKTLPQAPQVIEGRINRSIILT